MLVLLQIICAIFIGFYILGLLGRLWLRWFIAKKQKEFAQGKQSKGFYYSTSFGGKNNNNNKTNTKKPGEINIEQIKTTEKKVNTKVGDYVDYEEVK
ncbi:MAG: DUF4834 family protein [Rikenellaceae bacterium]